MLKMARPDRNEAVRRLDEVRMNGVSDESIVEYLIYNWMSSDQANEFLEDVADENGFSFEDDEEDEEDEEDEY